MTIFLDIVRCIAFGLIVVIALGVIGWLIDPYWGP